MSMELSEAEKERLEKRDVIDLLELEVRELEARLKLCRLKAVLERYPVEERKEFIDGQFDRNADTSTTVE